MPGNTKLEIRRVRPEELDRLALLWHEVFGDSREFVGEFCAAAGAFSGMPDTGITAAFYGERPVSMASLVPTVLREAGELRPCPYVFAVATAPEFRGRGLAREVLSEAARGEACLIPANGGLFDYWRAQGYTRTIRSRFPAPFRLPPDARPFEGDGRDMYRLYLELSGEGNAIIKPEGFFGLVARSWLREGCVYSVGRGWVIVRNGLCYDAAGVEPEAPLRIKGLMKSDAPAPLGLSGLNNMFEY